MCCKALTTLSLDQPPGFPPSLSAEGIEHAEYTLQWDNPPIRLPDGRGWWPIISIYEFSRQHFVYHRTKVFCCKERSPKKKKRSNSTSSLLLPSSWCWRGVCESWLFDIRLSQQIGRNRLGYDGSEPSEPWTHPFWQLPSTLPKSHNLSSYIEILKNKSKIIECSMSLVMIHLWFFLKSRLTLQVILPARASLVTLSLIDDSARP